LEVSDLNERPLRLVEIEKELKKRDARYRARGIEILMAHPVPFFRWRERGTEGGGETGGGRGASLRETERARKTTSEPDCN
jgi:hypothetical protein